MNIKSCRIIRVLHCIHSLDLSLGGPSRSVSSLLSAIADFDDIHVSLISECGPNMPEMSPRISTYPAEILNRRFWVPKWSTVLLLRKAIQNADVVHLHMYWNGFAALVLRESIRAGKPIVLSPRGSLHRDAIAYSSPWLKRLFTGLLADRQLRLVDSFHFQSVEEAQNSYTGRRNAPAKAIILDNGVDLPGEQYDLAAERLRIYGNEDSKINLFYLGRINRIKGIDLQIDVLAQLRSKGYDAVLHIAGPDDGLVEELRSHSRRKRVSDFVRFIGPIYSNEKTRRLFAANAVLMSSEFENNSNVALEVMAAGGILVATEGSIGPAAADAGAAIVVPRNVTALTSAIMTLLEDPGRSRTLRLNAQSFVAQQKSWICRATDMASFYRSLI